MKKQNYLERNKINLLWERTYIYKGLKKYRAEIEVLLKGEVVTFRHEYNDSETFDRLKSGDGVFDYFEHKFVEKIEDWFEENEDYINEQYGFSNKQLYNDCLLPMLICCAKSD